MACHVGPVGGFGRKPTSPQDTGWVSDKFSMSGDLIFMGLYDKRQGANDRVVLFPMEGALHFAFTPKPTITVAASQDFGKLREIYGMLHNVDQTMYVRAGFFTLPYGLLVEDHTSFIKEGRVESGTRGFDEVGIGAKLFSVRYKDSGIEAGLSGRPWFLNVAITGGVIGQEERAVPSQQGGTKKAITRRGGYISKNFAIGASMYTNDNDVVDRRILRYGAFGWAKAGKFVMLFEHDEGEEEQFKVSGSTQLSASYLELIYASKFPGQNWNSFTKLRYERLDPNRSVDGDLLQRWVFSYKFVPLEYISVETFYRLNKEQPKELNNDDIYVLTHLYF